MRIYNPILLSADDQGIKFSGLVVMSKADTLLTEWNGVTTEDINESKDLTYRNLFPRITYTVEDYVMFLRNNSSNGTLPKIRVYYLFSHELINMSVRGYRDMFSDMAHYKFFHMGHGVSKIVTSLCSNFTTVVTDCQFTKSIYDCEDIGDYLKCHYEEEEVFEHESVGSTIDYGKLRERFSGEEGKVLFLFKYNSVLASHLCRYFKTKLKVKVCGVTYFNIH